jgi:perosamine synthetase
VAEFERAFARYVGASHGLALSSCTTALHLAVVLAGVGPGDEVVVPSLSFIATANVVRYVGAQPVFADVDLATQNLTPATIQAVLTERTRAVIVVDQVGCPADLDPIKAMCEPLGVQVIEDAACAAGSTYKGRPVGGNCELAAFSFHPRKLLTTGEGGMLVTSREDWSIRGRRLREHGMSVSAAERHQGGAATIEQYLETGFNYRMTDIQAAVGLVQLGRLDGLVADRREKAVRYQKLLAGLPGLVTASDPEYGTTNYQGFWVLLPTGAPVERNEVLVRMQAAGISPRRGIMASHLEPAYRGHPHGPLPVTVRLTEDSLILPLHHELTDADQELIVGVLADCLDAS